MAALARALAPTTDMTDAMFDDLAAELSERQAKEFALSDRGREPTDEELDQAAAYSGEVAHRIVAAKATSLAGLKAKAQAAVWATGGEDTFHEFHRVEPGATYDQFAFTIINDLISLPSATVHTFPQPVTQAEPAPSEIQRAAAEFVVCKADHDEAYQRLLTASDAAEALHPTPPQIIQDWQRPGKAYNRLRLAELDANAAQVTWPKPKGSPRVEAFDHWRAQIDAIDSSFGVPGLDDVMERAGVAEDRAAQRVAALRPATVQEAVVKYAVLLASWGDLKNKEIISGEVFYDFLSDLEHLASATH